MTATTTTPHRPKIDRRALDAMRARLGADHPLVRRTEAEHAAWDAFLAEQRAANDAAIAREDAARAERSAAVAAEAEARLAAKQETTPLRDEMRARLRRRGSPALHEAARR